MPGLTMDPYTAWKAWGWVNKARAMMREWGRIAAVTWRRGNRLSEEWLREQFKELKFDTAEELSSPYLRGCISALKVNGIFWEGQALEFFADEETRVELSQMYERGSLVRKESGGRLDACGYVTWGPMLHRVHSEIRQDMREVVEDLIRKSPEARQVAQDRGWVWGGRVG